MNYKTMKTDKLPELFDKIKKAGKTVLAPRKKGNKTFFSTFDSFDQITFDYVQSALSPKSVLFPRVEELLTYKNQDDSYSIKEPELKDEVVVFGMRPCDGMALDYLSDFFLKENPDKLLQDRKNNTTFISLACKKFDNDCFCTSVGSSPAETKGSDLCFTDMGNGSYYVEVVTEKGKKLVDAFPDLFADSKEMNKVEQLAKVPVRFELKNLTPKIPTVFETNIWLDQSLACIGCGACAYVCPTCSCFDIQDECNPKGGTRLRCWDSCAFGQFTIHASGHNPREVQSNRWRNRVQHKFNYSVENMNTISCVGCGRCIRVCPAGMSIIEHLISVEEA